MLILRVKFEQEELIGEEEQAFAGEEVEFDPAYQALLWEAELSLLKRLVQNPNLSEGFGIIQSFYQQRIDTTEGAYVEQRIKLKELCSPSEALLDEAESLAISFELKLTELEQVDQILLGDPGNPDFVVFRSQLLDDLRQIGISIATNATAIQSEIEANADLLLQANAQLPVVHTYQENEVTVAEIFLNTLAKGSYDLQSSELTLLQSIADQCILEGGNSVGFARTILGIVEGKHWIDDNCGGIIGEGVENEPTANKPNSAYSISPNPTSSEVTILSKEPFGQDAKLVIHSANGEVLLNLELPVSEFTFMLGADELPSGVYFLHISAQDEIKYSEKLIILK